MKALIIFEKEFNDIPPIQRDRYKRMVQWSYRMIPTVWHTLDSQYAESFKQQFPNHNYRDIYILDR